MFRVAPDGTATVVIEDVPSPNGMAYSPDNEAFFVASTSTEDGQLTRYEVDGSGMPDEASAVEILQLGPASTLDGIAAGFVYVAANLKGSRAHRSTCERANPPFSLRCRPVPR